MRKYLLITIALLAVLSCGQENKDVSTAVSFDDVLATRRSIRDFDSSKEVTEAQVREILTAAQDAPSWTNSQPSRYYVAISPDKADAVRELIGDGIDEGRYDRYREFYEYLYSRRPNSAGGYK